MKEKALFAAEVLIVYALCVLVQQNVTQIPVIGQWLPGYKPAATA